MDNDSSGIPHGGVDPIGGRVETGADLDWRRLRAIEAIWDVETIGVLSCLGIGKHWKCLELGAGAGSIARWLAYQCPRGRVIATEVDLRFLDGPGVRNFDAIFHDAVEGDDFPDGYFDLIHARAILAHLPDRQAVIDRAARWLAPGGWLVVEEPALFPVDSSPNVLFRRCMEAYAETMARCLGTDLRWSRALPTALTDAGLRASGIRVAAVPVGDGGPGDEFWRVCWRQVGPEMVSTGLLTPEELEDAMDQFEDPEFMDLSWALVSAWAFKP
ncbi:methyltransferase domain-containing protein [Streptomyces lavendulae]|uniref:class I SAM-dependent methyltransferase n=1 Tax=Streptomyces lavendulae TaxID=1914 RepID=UPI0033F64ABF